MNKNQVDQIVATLLQEEKEQKKSYTKEEIYERFQEQYSKDQMERIYHRYCYLANQN